MAEGCPTRAWNDSPIHAKGASDFSNAVTIITGEISHKKEHNRWVSLKMLCTPKANGFHDHCPYYINGYNWEYTLFSDKPRFSSSMQIRDPNSTNHFRDVSWRFLDPLLKQKVTPQGGGHFTTFLDIQQNVRWDICVGCFAGLAISHTIIW